MRFGDVFIDGRSHPSAVPGGLWHPHGGGRHGAAWLLAQRGAAVAASVGKPQGGSAADQWYG